MFTKPKPKVLVLDEWLPYPCDTGKKIRTYNLLKNLTMDFDITYLAYADPVIEVASVNHLQKLGMRVETVQDDRLPRKGLRYWSRVAQSVFSPYPFASRYHYTTAYRQRLDEVLNKYQPNLVQCEWTFYARYICHLNGLPTVISAHNVEFQQWERMASVADSLLVKEFSRLQAEKVRRFEISAYPLASLCLAVSDNDRRLIEGFGARCMVVENGVDTDFFDSDAISIPELETRMVYTASMDAFSNQDAARYFIREILPIIKKRRKEAELLIVGKNPPPSLTAYFKRENGINFTGTVDDVRPFIASAAMSVVPLRVGGGTRLKILEAMAMGKAVVSTSIGCEGLDLVRGRHLLVADNPADFAEKVIQLMDDNELRASLGKAAREHVLQKYDWKPIAKKQGAAWRSVLSA